MMQPSDTSPTEFHSAAVGNVDRAALVSRHNPTLSEIDSQSPLQVGNGEFAMAVDATGLQTMPHCYSVEPSGTLLGTQSQWGWHSLPNRGGYKIADSFQDYDTHVGRVPYVDLSSLTHDVAGQAAHETWLRSNPHRLDLGRIGLWTESRITPRSLNGIDQTLDLSSGIISSKFGVFGVPYEVRTAAHPTRDLVAVAARGPAGTQIGISLRFPYGSEEWGDAADWSAQTSHSTRVAPAAGGWAIVRTLDETSYTVLVSGEGLVLEVISEHDIVLRTTGDLNVIVEFALEAPSEPMRSVEAVFEASATHWADFWASGAAVDLSASDHPGALELERRVVLSQYLTAVNCGSSQPPSETGLMLNSWRGKFHLEMHWWHGAHFAHWNRPERLSEMLSWYKTIRPVAIETAQRQGLDGARWPKQIDPSGQESPSSIGPFLIWQQPQPIQLAELLYRCDPSRETLERWLVLVKDSADFMASFASLGSNGYELGPPVIPAQEPYFEVRAISKNPTFELALWAWALEAAAQWFERLNLQPPESWRKVASNLVRPHQRDGVYMALSTEPYLIRTDHPSMFAALGVLPQTDLIDPEVMSRTMDDVLGDWDWSSTWGWDYPMTAMTAARLGRKGDATDALLMDTPKNTYLANGHNRQEAHLPIYLPGNGGVLSAVGLMAGGWDGSDGPNPGFSPEWKVSHEGLIRVP